MRIPRLFRRRWSFNPYQESGYAWLDALRRFIGVPKRRAATLKDLERLARWAKPKPRDRADIRRVQRLMPQYELAQEIAALARKARDLKRELPVDTILGLWESYLNAPSFGDARLYREHELRTFLEALDRDMSK